MFIIEFIIKAIVIFATIVLLVGVPYMFYEEWRDARNRRNKQFWDEINSS